MATQRIDWTGVYPPVVTPFHADGGIDEAKLRAIVDLLIAEGCHGIIATGSTGEWFSVSDDERKRIFDICHEQVAGRVPLLAGTSTIGTDHAVALTRYAKKIGYDGVMVLPPPYALPTIKEVIAHFEAIGKTDLPIMIYNNPPRTSINIDAALADRLAQIDMVVAIKDSSKDLFQKAETCARVKDRLAVFTGMEPYGLTMIQRGAVGIVSMIANLCARDVVAYCEHALAGRYGEAIPHQQMIDNCFQLVSRFGLGNYPTIKGCMKVLGRPGGELRQPYLMPDGATLEAFRQALAEIGLTAEAGAAQAAAE